MNAWMDGWMDKQDSNRSIQITNLFDMPFSKVAHSSSLMATGVVDVKLCCRALKCNALSVTVTHFGL